MDRLLPWLLYEILKHFLSPKLLITTSEEAIVLHSPSMTASVTVNRTYAATYNDQVTYHRIASLITTTSSSTIYRNVLHHTLKTVIVQQDVSCYSDENRRYALVYADSGGGTFPSVQPWHVDV